MDEKTFLKEKMLLPGIIFCFRGKVLHKYWDASYLKGFGNVQAYYDNFRSIFSDAVTRHMISDVPLGSYLSGALIQVQWLRLQRKHRRRIETFTGKFKEGGGMMKVNVREPWL